MTRKASDFVFAIGADEETDPGVLIEARIVYLLEGIGGGEEDEE